MAITVHDVQARRLIAVDVREEGDVTWTTLNYFLAAGWRYRIYVHLAHALIYDVDNYNDDGIRLPYGAPSAYGRGLVGALWTTNINAVEALCNAMTVWTSEDDDPPATPVGLDLRITFAADGETCRKTFSPVVFGEDAAVEAVTLREKPDGGAANLLMLPFRLLMPVHAANYGGYVTTEYL